MKFETFAKLQIRYAMLNELRRIDYLTPWLRARVNKISKTKDKLTRLRQEPSLEEVAQALEMDVSEAWEISQLALPVELSPELNLLANEPDLDEKIERIAVRQAIEIRGASGIV